MDENEKLRDEKNQKVICKADVHTCPSIGT